MTLEEYYIKYDNIEETHPPEEGMEFPDTNYHFRAIIKKWQQELSPEDLETVLFRERAFARRMSS